MGQKYILDLDYSALIKKYLKTELASEILDNLTYVQIYKDQIKGMPIKHQQISYRQLGAIAFSCVESLWKGIVGFINEKCRNKNCKEKCNYFKFDTLEKLNNAKPFEIMKHLSAMRIFYLHTSEEDKITELQSLRNHIHLTRILLDGDCSQSFDINFVENISRIFYVTLNQIELFNHFFDEDNFCIKELDDDGYEQTKELSVKERNFYHTQKIVLAAINLFHNALLKT